MLSWSRTGVPVNDFPAQHVAQFWSTPGTFEVDLTAP
jgi:hypothetical protein